MGSTYIAREGDSQYCDRMGRISFAALLFCISQLPSGNEVCAHLLHYTPQPAQIPGLDTKVLTVDPNPSDELSGHTELLNYIKQIQEKGENVDLSTVPNQTKTLICESLESIDKDILSTFNVDIDMKALCQNNSSSRVSLPSLLTMSVFLFLCSRLTAIQ